MSRDKDSLTRLLASSSESRFNGLDSELLCLFPPLPSLESQSREGASPLTPDHPGLPQARVGLPQPF